MTSANNYRRSSGIKPLRQRGVILFVTLIALVVLLISSIALVRSFDTTMILAGNLSFKRDLINQSERAIFAANASMNDPTKLGNTTAVQSNVVAYNYYATLLPSDVHGLPNMITDDSLWTLGSGNDIVDPITGVNVRYVIDRMCNVAGPASPNTCIVGYAVVPGGTVGISQGKPNGPIVYRVSIRVKGPRNTQTYVQTTLQSK